MDSLFKKEYSDLIEHIDFDMLNLISRDINSVAINNSDHVVATDIALKEIYNEYYNIDNKLQKNSEGYKQLQAADGVLGVAP